MDEQQSLTNSKPDIGQLGRKPSLSLTANFLSIIERAFSPFRHTMSYKLYRDEIDQQSDYHVIGKLAEDIKEHLKEASAFSLYNLSLSLKSVAYRRLHPGEIAAAHVISFTTAIAIEILLALFIYVNASRGIEIVKVAEEGLFVGVVHAQSSQSSPSMSSPLVGPNSQQSALGLPQSTVVGLVWLAAVVLAVVILGLLWSGYLARSKNEKAQTILQHLVNTVLSVATGAVLSKGVP
jgi:hypothetical protein